MGPLSSLVLSLLGAAAWAQDAANISELTSSGKYPDLSVSFNPRPASDVSRFVAAAPKDAKARAEAWGALERLLAGGKYDDSGEGMRRALRLLPPEELYKVAGADAERKKIIDKLGEGSWYKNGVANFKEGLNECLGTSCAVPRTLCKDRANDVDFAMQHSVAPDSKVWKSRVVSAKQNQSDEHSAACYAYDDGKVRVEFVADAWADAHVPAGAWWQARDAKTYQALLDQGGKDWCGPAYKTIEEANTKAYNELLKKQEAEAKENERRRQETNERLGKIPLGF